MYSYQVCSRTCFRDGTGESGRSLNPILAFDIHANNITDLHQPFSAVSRLYTIPMAMQFGFMIGDFLPFFPEMKPNLLFAVHHIVTMVLAFCIVFWMPACFASLAGQRKRSMTILVCC